METSAKTGLLVKEMFHGVTEKVLDQIESGKIDPHDDVLKFFYHITNYPIDPRYQDRLSRLIHTLAGPRSKDIKEGHHLRRAGHRSRPEEKKEEGMLLIWLD